MTCTDPSSGSPALIRAIGAKRLVVAAGMVRSGSTWLYNAARLCCREAGAGVYGTWIADFRADRALEADCILVKTHNADEALRDRADRVLTSHRDLRDVVRSARSLGWAASDAAACGLLRQAVADHAFWSTRAEIDLRYEDVMGDQNGAAALTGRALGVDLDAETAVRVASATAALGGPPSDGTYDPLTLLHARHRFDGPVETWERMLPSPLLHRIEREHGAWLRQRGYTVGAKA